MANEILLADKKALMAEYLLAESAVLRGQEYTIKDRSLTRADLRWIQNGRKGLEAEICLLERGASIKVKQVLFRDG